MIKQLIPLLATATVVRATPLAIRQSNDTNSGPETVYSFADVPTSAELSWVPCFENFTCANLEVPLDYENLEAGTTNIAFMRLLAPEQPAKGDIILNAGGPGNSAANVKMVAGAAKFLNTTSYNLVGMDIRGVNNSGPAANCFIDEYTRDYYVMEKWFSTINATDEASRKKYWELTGGFVDMCFNRLNDSAKYINSPAVSADMVYYTEKVAESEGRDPSQELVNYYGISYGTYLGATFAKLYPDRVGRFIIDGVGDVEDYYSGRWQVDVQQADDSLGAFFTYCFEAGTKCPFFKDDASADAMHKRFDAIVAELNEKPIVVTDEDLVEFPFSMDGRELLANILGNLYNFQYGFPTMALGLSAIEKNRNATIYMLGLVDAIVTPRESTYVPDHSSIYSRQFYVCNDMNQRLNLSSPEEFGKNVEKTTKISKYFGANWGSWFTVNCWNWKLTPPESQTFPAEYSTTETKNPILLTGNTLDPVTSSYEKMAGFFPDSRVLLQEAVGHGVLEIYSTCTTGHVSHFLETGELPPENTVCDVDVQPFDIFE